QRLAGSEVVRGGASRYARRRVESAVGQTVNPAFADKSDGGIEEVLTPADHENDTTIVVPRATIVVAVAVPIVCGTRPRSSGGSPLWTSAVGQGARPGRVTVIREQLPEGSRRGVDPGPLPCDQPIKEQPVDGVEDQSREHSRAGCRHMQTNQVLAEKVQPRLT